VAECLRVLKPNGMAFFAYINRNTFFTISMYRGELDLQSRLQIMKTGENDVFYGMNFNEPSELFGGFDFEKITDIGVDSLAYQMSKTLNDAGDEDFAAFMKWHLDTCEQPSIIGHSCHGLWIGRKA